MNISFTGPLAVTARERAGEGEQEIRRLGEQESRSAGEQESRSAGVQECRRAGEQGDQEHETRRAGAPGAGERGGSGSMRAGTGAE